MRTMHPDLLRRTFKVHGTGHWSFAYRIVVDEDFTLEQRLQWRLTCWREETTIDLGAPINGAVFYPYAIGHTDIVTDGEGSVPTFDVIIDNTTFQLGRYVERGGRGYRGKKVEVYGFNVETVNLGFATKFHGYVQAANVVLVDGRSALSLTCSAGNDMQSIDLPHDAFEPMRCRHRRYAAGRCGAIVTASTPEEFRSCPRHWAACIARRDHMASVGLPERLPHMFGGQPGIPVERGVR